MIKKLLDENETFSSPYAISESPDKSNPGLDAGAIKKLLDEHETATRLNLKVATLRRWRWSARGPPFLKLGGAVRYHPDDIAAFIRQARRTSTTQFEPHSDNGAS